MTDKQKIHQSLEEVGHVQDCMRIIIEMITDTMTQYDLSSKQAMLTAQERIIVLSKHALSQIQDLDGIATGIKEACNA